MSVVSELLTRKSHFKPAAAPATPYQRAEEVWNERQGSLIRSAHNWRMAFFAQALVSGILVFGLLYQAGRSKVQPYLIEHNSATGEALGLGKIPTWNYTPQINEIRHFLGSWLTMVRGVSVDPVVIKHNWLDAYAFTTQGAANQLNDWAQKDERLSKIGQETVSIEILSINPIAESHSYQVRWKETVRTREGALKEESAMTGVFPIKIEAPDPKEDRILQVNPLGIKIDGGFQWSKDI
jgi:type IV secretion system protein VirB5